MQVVQINWIYCFIFFIAAALIVVAFVPLIKKIAFCIGAVDEPSDRRVHKTTTARLGGVAIYLGIVLCCILAAVGVKFLNWEIPLSYNNTNGVNYYIVAFGTSLMFIVGVVDDIKCLRPRTKLLWQIIAATIVCTSGLLLNRIHNPFNNSFIEFGWLSYPITIFFLIAFANVINLIDGLDGLAAGISAIVAFSIFIFALVQNKADAAILSIGIAGACCAFLIFNFNPAKIFMGDSGSLTLGFLLGIAALLANTRTTVVVTLLAPVMAAGIPVLDTLFAIVRRKTAHKRIDEADKEHIHHKLLQSGLSTKQTVLIMWAWTAFLSICGIVITVMKNPIANLLIFIAAFIFTFLIIWRLHLLEPILKHHYNHRKKDNRKERKTLYGIYNKRESKNNKDKN